MATDLPIQFLRQFVEQDIDEFIAQPTVHRAPPGTQERGAPSIVARLSIKRRQETTMNESASYSYYPSPIGDLLLISDGEALTGLHLPRHDGSPASPGTGTECRRDDRAFRDVRDRLRAYFAGERFAFVSR
jgi:hypothetical protein